MTTIAYSRFDISNFSVGILNDNKTSALKSANINYEGAGLRIQTPELKINSYCMPAFNKK